MGVTHICTVTSDPLNTHTKHTWNMWLWYKLFISYAELFPLFTCALLCSVLLVYFFYGSNAIIVLHEKHDCSRSVLDNPVMKERRWVLDGSLSCSFHQLQAVRITFLSFRFHMLRTSSYFINLLLKTVILNGWQIP